MSATKSNHQEGATPPSPKFFDQVYDFFASVRFAIFLLSFIAISSVFGTLVKQGASPEEYLSVYSESTYAIIRFLGLDDIFHGRWFLFVISLFVLNLVLCTVERFTRFIRGRRDITIPPEKTLSAMDLHFLAKGRKVDEVSGFFKGYRSRKEQEEARVLERGSMSRYGVYFIHLSIILILLGGLIGAIWGYRGSLILNVGETKDAMTLRGGVEKSKPLGFTVKCSDFKVSFYPTGQPKEYVSKVEILENGRKVLEKDIKVNHPLSYNGTNIYQASYGSTPVFFFDIGGEPVTLRQGSAYKKDNLTLMAVRYEQSVHDFGPGVQIAYLEGKDQKIAWFLKDVPRLRQRDIMGTPIRLDEIKPEYYTGLEVARDPGVYVVWTGFALILLGLYVNFFVYYRRVYLRQVSGGVLVAGVSFKNREAFKEEFDRLKERVG